MRDELHGLISWLPVGEANYARDDDHDKWVTNIYEPGTVNRLAVVATGMDKGVACWLAIKLNETSKAASNLAPHDEGRPHIVAGEFQSDKYPATPRGKVPLSVKDKTAQDLLWEYAQRRRPIDAEFASDLEFALTSEGYSPAPHPDAELQILREVVQEIAELDKFGGYNSACHRARAGLKRVSGQ